MRQLTIALNLQSLVLLDQILQFLHKVHSLSFGLAQFVFVMGLYFGNLLVGRLNCLLLLLADDLGILVIWLVNASWIIFEFSEFTLSFL